jgi:hypothetical protein
MDFYEIWYVRIFQKFVATWQVLLKYDKNDRYLIWREMYIYYNILLNSS